MKQTILVVACLIFGAVVYAQVLAESIGFFNVPRTLSYGNVDKVEDGDTTCYIATTRKGVSISCVR